ncbi:MAG: CpaD family pilus assembly protein [Pseudomonadota bacterium]
MTSRTHAGPSAPSSRTARSGLAGSTKLALAVTAALALAGCRDVMSPHQFQKGWTVLNHNERHPIIVSKKPSHMKLAVHRGSYGLNHHQKHRLGAFLRKYKSRGATNARLVVKAPSGSPNEVAAMHAVHEIRRVIVDHGFDESVVSVEAYHDAHNPAPPVRLSYKRYVAEGPTCGHFPTNLGHLPRNEAHADFGCANQANFAAMVANPADLVGPRTETPRSSGQRDDRWEKFKKGESTVSRRDQSEQAGFSN